MPRPKLIGFAWSYLFPAAVLALLISVSIWLIQSARPDGSDALDLADGPLVVLPPVVRSDGVNIPDDCQVIGITHNGKSRAYVVSAFFKSSHHVINDLVSGTPFTITYCDRNDCTRVFTRADLQRPLDVTVGGWIGTDLRGSLLLRVGSKLFRQDTAKGLSNDEPFPYAMASFERTTWKAWRTKHPDSDVYLKFPDDRMRSVPNS